MDPDLYPNVNWRNVILKDLALNNESFLSISGGGSNARYYLSLSTQLKDAIFNQEKGANKYDVNVKYHKYSFRTNVDANLTKSTQLSLGLDQTMINQNAPGFGDDNQALWTAQANLTPVTVPVRYSNGLLPSYGTNADQYSPYVILNYTGYKENRRTTQQMNIGLHQELDVITKGLSIEGRFAYTGNSIHNMSRTKMPDLYYAKGRLRDGSLDLRRTVAKKDVAYSKYVENDSRYYYEFRTDYKRNFGDHRVSGLLHYYQEEYKTSTAEDDITAIPQRYQSLSGRATYSYKDTYLLEGNIGYTGSENFKPGSQYGIFPAIAVGWTPSQYQWTKDHIPFINYLKFRFSYGEVGNDRISNTRFPYLTTVIGTGNGGWSGGGLTEEKVGADNLKWESSRKTDLGIDFYLWKSKIQGNIDFLPNNTTGIFQQRATVPLEAGFVSLPYSNIGSML
jgi:TonB-linked SusC/RagA family outer membrane protein